MFRIPEGKSLKARRTGDASNGSGIFLTFDDGPDPIWTPRVLEALRLADATATFFVIAPLAVRFPRLISELRSAGHAIGLHCARHVRHTDMTRQEVEADVGSSLRNLERLGITPRLWRPPWGILAPWTAAVAEDFGLTLVPWTADTHDWRGDNAQTMLEVISPTLGPDAIVLMHDGLGPGARRVGCEETVRLAGPLVERARSLGCEPAAMNADTVTALPAPKAAS
jgi:peptidoglycan/xylan/chitin deacetylase (PgdA/CDA1 family)